MRTLVAPIASALLLASSASAQTPSTVLGPRSLMPAQVICTDLPVTTAPTQKVWVRGGHSPDGRLSLAEGDVAVLNGGIAEGLSAGQRYLVRRVRGGQRGLTREVDSYDAIRTAGWLTITSADQGSALGKIDFACDSIEPGDYLETFAEPALPDRSADMAEPRFSDRAHVLFGADRRDNLGDGDLFSIDRGRDQGVAPGDRFAIYRDRHDGAPIVHVADAVVLEPSGQTSKAVLVMVRDAVMSGDLAFLRRP